MVAFKNDANIPMWLGMRLLHGGLGCFTGLEINLAVCSYFYSLVHVTSKSRALDQSLVLMDYEALYFENGIPCCLCDKQKQEHKVTWTEHAWPDSCFLSHSYKG